MDYPLFKYVSIFSLDQVVVLNVTPMVGNVNLVTEHTCGIQPTTEQFGFLSLLLCN